MQSQRTTFLKNGKKEKYHPIILYLQNDSFKAKRKIDTSDKHYLKEIVINRAILQKVIKEVLQVKENDPRWNLEIQTDIMTKEKT